jgi:propionyl-CoA carboxylase alpha chain
MKMQNIIKASVDGKIKKVLVKPGESVAVDQLLIEFE